MKLKHQQLLPNTSNAHLLHIFAHLLKAFNTITGGLTVTDPNPRRITRTSAVTLKCMSIMSSILFCTKVPLQFFFMCKRDANAQFPRSSGFEKWKEIKGICMWMPKILKHHKTLKPHAWNFSIPSPCESIGIGNCKRTPLSPKMTSSRGLLHCWGVDVL